MLCARRLHSTETFQHPTDALSIGLCYEFAIGIIANDSVEDSALVGTNAGRICRGTVQK